MTNLSKPDIDRMGIDAFLGNLIVNIKEDLTGGRSASQISDYYMDNYDIDVTFSTNSVNVRLYTESHGWNQTSYGIALK